MWPFSRAKNKNYSQPAAPRIAGQRLSASTDGRRIKADRLLARKQRLEQAQAKHRSGSDQAALGFLEDELNLVNALLKRSDR